MYKRSIVLLGIFLGNHVPAVAQAPAPRIVLAQVRVAPVGMSIKSPQELAGMLAAGAVVRHMLEAMKQAVISGVTTADLDALGARVMREHGARSAPALVYKFPGVSCISVNDEAVHGIRAGGNCRKVIW